MNTHHTGDIDWDALGAQLEREAELHAPSREQAAGWLRELLRTSDGADTAAGRVLDVGSGPGVATEVLGSG
ncbi:hypothetical protein [Streptomyces sp. H27-D2]|uniref:hypothetical protein n=1 Tax=Streptomyces sp. H27-D2 TaxID=3046304 RepID=UPI002DB6B742|nr:hypothetical protein [Streptomyces sp. H27-D2]MEC4020210.1 hypothetical protein [Streptomyces sp. H27-D2]